MPHSFHSNNVNILGFNPKGGDDIVKVLLLLVKLNVEAIMSSRFCAESLPGSRDLMMSLIGLRIGRASDTTWVSPS